MKDTKFLMSEIRFVRNSLKISHLKHPCVQSVLNQIIKILIFSLRGGNIVFKRQFTLVSEQIRVKNGSTGKQNKMDALMEEKKSLLKKKNVIVEGKQRVKNIEEEITQEFEDKEYEKLIKTLGHLESEGDQTDNINIWK